MDKGGIIASLAALAVLYGCTAMREDAPANESPILDAGAQVACGASMFQGMVGEPEGEIHEPSLPTPYRIIGPDDLVTQDYRPDRLNIYLDSGGHVKSVRCG